MYNLAQPMNIFLFQKKINDQFNFFKRKSVKYNPFYFHLYSK
jgi:hypothetical protein